ncbi:hypothetical protein F5Y18DRAFT_373248 [Xylariaceae sp. FL1019]|nr:hypothetical protein F5Y18DRAFT_373248 [Xylariaceae sp. FL1019]
MHLDALDGLAATYDARGHINMAFVTAEAMVNLFPREPKGFLRLGKLLRIKHQYRDSTSHPSSPRRRALLVSRTRDTRARAQSLAFTKSAGHSYRSSVLPNYAKHTGIR